MLPTANACMTANNGSTTGLENRSRWPGYHPVDQLPQWGNKFTGRSPDRRLPEVVWVQCLKFHDVAALHPHHRRPSALGAAS